ncbi:MAG: hypothetical protein JWN00_1893 [Actinomycetia bacterium]|nr:hypothetical protein [Actinomycetes bacterium]
MSIFRGTPEAEEARRAHEAALTDTPRPQELSQDWLRRLCLESGADDAGFVELAGRNSARRTTTRAGCSPRPPR